MKNENWRGSKGITLIEICIGFVIFTILAGSLYKLWSDANKKRAIGEARSILTAEIGRILNQLKLDLNQGEAGTIKTNGTTTGFELELKLPPNESSNNPRLVRYEYSAPYLLRTENGKTHLMSKNIVEMSVVPFEKDGQIATGQFVAHVRGSLAIDGLSVPETHTQSQFIVAREDVSASFDPNWRPVNISGIFEGHGDVLAALVEDMHALVNVSKSAVDKMVADAKSKVDEELEKVKNKLTQGLDKVKDNIGKLNTSIRNMSWQAFIEKPLIDLTPESRKNCAYAIREALANMETVKDMDFGKLIKIAADHGFLSSFRQQEVLKIFEAKLKIFEAGRNLIEQMKLLNIPVPQDILKMFGD